MKNLEPITLKDECRSIFLSTGSLFHAVRRYRDVMLGECANNNGQEQPSLMEATLRVEEWRDEGNWRHYANLPHSKKGSQSEAYNIRRQRKDAERAIRYIQAIGGSVSGVEDLSKLREKEQIALVNEMLAELQNGHNNLSDVLRRYGNTCRTFANK